MGARRQRFTPAERADFTAGREVEWLNGSRWVDAMVTNGEVRTDTLGVQYLDLVYIGPTTRAITHNAEVRGYPKAVRLPE